MFTGIVEDTGIITNINKKEGNLNFVIRSKITNELKIDQSIAHNGICLTVVDITGDQYTVTAINETIEKTNIGSWNIGDKINLERSLKVNGRVDGHFVQGHVDTTAEVINIKNQNGSWLYTFELNYPNAYQLLVEKGSICINGVSLTLVNVKDHNPASFSVAIIPYTHENTNFNSFTIGSKVNIEFDVLGKYIQKQLSFQQANS